MYEFLKRAAIHLKTFGFTPRSFGNFYKLFRGRRRQGKVIRLKLPQYLHPIYLRSGTTDLPTFRELIGRREYALDLGFTPSAIVDCGANIGLAAVFFKNRYPNAKIVSIEPEESNYQMLLRNTAAYDDVHPVKAGIWHRSARLTVSDAFGYGHWGFTTSELPASHENQQVTIDAVSIKDIMKRFELPHIDVLKIDIEGSEKEIFSENFEKWLPHVRVLIIELHDRMKAGCSRALFEALHGYDYSTAVSGENIVLYFNK